MVRNLSRLCISIKVVNLDFLEIQVISLKIYLYKLGFTFPIGEKNMLVDIKKQ